MPMSPWGTLILNLITVSFSHTRGNICHDASNLKVFLYVCFDEQYLLTTDFLIPLLLMFFCLLSSPVKDTIVTNDRWCSSGCRCQHGGVYTCKDRYNPGES